MLEQEDDPVRTSLKRHRARIALAWRRNINLLPIPRTRLRYMLGPANPPLMTMSEEPWSFRRRGFSPLLAATTAWILVPMRSTPPFGSASAHTGHPPTSILSELWGIGTLLSPGHFQGQ